MRSLERVRTRGSRNRDSRVWSGSLDVRSPCQVGRSAYREPPVDVGVIRGDPLVGELLGVSAPECRVGNPATAKEFVDRVRQLFSFSGWTSTPRPSPSVSGSPSTQCRRPAPPDLSQGRRSATRLPPGTGRRARWRRLYASPAGAPNPAGAPDRPGRGQSSGQSGFPQRTSPSSSVTGGISEALPAPRAARRGPFPVAPGEGHPRRWAARAAVAHQTFRQWTVPRATLGRDARSRRRSAQGAVGEEGSTRGTAARASVTKSP